MQNPTLPTARPASLLPYEQQQAAKLLLASATPQQSIQSESKQGTQSPASGIADTEVKNPVACRTSHIAAPIDIFPQNKAVPQPASQSAAPEPEKSLANNDVPPPTPQSVSPCRYTYQTERNSQPPTSDEARPKAFDIRYYMETLRDAEKFQRRLPIRTWADLTLDRVFREVSARASGAQIQRIDITLRAFPPHPKFTVLEDTIAEGDAEWFEEMKEHFSEAMKSAQERDGISKFKIFMEPIAGLH